MEWARREPTLDAAFTLFVTSFTTLLAVINPLEAMPVFMNLVKGKPLPEQLAVAKRACVYSLVLMFFFLVFGSLLLKIFGVPLAMVRVVGGIVLMKIGFELFTPTPGASIVEPGASDPNTDIAFVPLAMPIMFGPGAIATVLGMVSLIRADGLQIAPLVAIVAAMVATVGVIYLCLARSDAILKRVGPMGLDAATRIVGFFVAAMGGGLIFHGTLEAIRTMS